MTEPAPDLDETAVPKPSPPDDGSIQASIARLVASGKELAEAEFAWARLKAGLLANGLRRWLIFASLAMIFLVIGVLILIGSAMIALASVVGWLVSSLIVAGIAIALAAIFAFIARGSFSRLFDEEGI